MQLFYTTLQDGDFLYLEGEEYHHCLNVLRHSIGDTINVTNGTGDMFACKIIDKTKSAVRLKIVETVSREIPEHAMLTIAIAPTKNIDRFEWFIEKATEIGVGRIVPILAKRSERSIIKPERLMKLAISAMKQSNHNFLPILSPLTKFEELIKNEKFQIHLIAHCNSNELTHISSYIKRNQKTIICIGPEGDFTAEEIILSEKSGFHGVSLGKSRLRTETAGLYACISFHQSLI